MIVDMPSAVEFFSSFTRLVPGDVIATGTPGGVGFARQPPVWLHPGDVIEVTVEGVGTIRNRVVAEARRPPAGAGAPSQPEPERPLTHSLTRGGTNEAPRPPWSRPPSPAGAALTACSSSTTTTAAASSADRRRPRRAAPGRIQRGRQHRRPADRIAAHHRGRRAVQRSRRRARPDLPGLLLRRDRGDQRRGRRARAPAHLQERRHPRRPRRRRARGQPDVRLDLEPGARHRLHVGRGGLGGAGHQRAQDGDVLHDRAVGVRQRALPLLLPPGAAGPRGVLRDGGHRAAAALQEDRAGVRQRHRLADLHPAGHRGAEEGRDDADHQPDARPERHHLPHRGRGDRRSRTRTRS